MRKKRMLFNSFQFFIFYIFVFFCFFSLPQRFRWILLLLSSIYFYMCWIPKYVAFLFFMIIVDYCCGIGMGQSSSSFVRKFFLSVSLFSNLGLLFIFKYFNFFSHNVSALLGHSFFVLHYVLPLGISFHVFQSLSYTIEVYRRRVKAEKHIGIFALYVMFFPQLVAGPIERPQNLLPQFHQERKFSYANFRIGAQLFLWGLFKKICIADMLSYPVRQVYASPTLYSGPILMLTTVYFAIQIYCDFSGYTDIARGVAKMMGYDLMLNFRQPYFARSIKEFWQRWHISLSTWFRDYVYFPLGGSRVSKTILFRNLIIVFILSGLWHGAAWTFVIWGALHGFYMIAGEGTRAWRKKIIDKLNLEKSFFYHIMEIFITLNLVIIGWVFFRANSLQNAWYIISHMYIPTKIKFSDVSYGVGLEEFQTLLVWVLIALLFMVDYFIEHKPSNIVRFWQKKSLRWAIYTAGFYSLIFFGVWGQIQFIYFQF